MMISLSAIRENSIALRRVDKESERFKDLLKMTPILKKPITVRQRQDPDDPSSFYYEIIDGLHRFTAAKHLGWEEMECKIVHVCDGECLELQIIKNSDSYIRTASSEYTNHLKRILSVCPLMTLSEMANRLHKSVQWIKDRLGLDRLDPEIMTLVAGNQIILVNAYTLAKLPKDEQADWVDRAMVERADKFVPAVMERMRTIRDRRRAGRADHLYNEIKSNVKPPSATTLHKMKRYVEKVLDAKPENVVAALREPDGYELLHGKKEVVHEWREELPQPIFREGWDWTRKDDKIRYIRFDQVTVYSIKFKYRNGDPKIKWAIRHPRLGVIGTAWGDPGNALAWVDKELPLD